METDQALAPQAAHAEAAVAPCSEEPYCPPSPPPAAPDKPDPLPGPADPLFALLKEKIAVYLKSEDIVRIEAAYHFAAEAHSGQTRKSGELYIVHPLAVASIVADWHLNAHALCAALLHDVVEDTYISKAEIAERFGQTAADLVDGLSKLDKLQFRSHEEEQAANFYKMLLAMSNDLQVILIKLADRLHNMRTLFVMRPDKRRRIASETLEIYAPIARRLGVDGVFQELEDLSFVNKYPWRHRVLARAVAAERGNRRRLLVQLQAGIEERLPQWGVEAEVQGREKRLYSIYRKMMERIIEARHNYALAEARHNYTVGEKRRAFSHVYDIHGFRLIVPDVSTCYLALGALHSIYQPYPDRFKDYIAIPRENGYRSLHTTLIGPGGVLAEVQIRTREMHRIAESGVAAHWLYKADDKSINELQQQTHAWLQSLLDLQMNSGGASEFLEQVKVNLFPGEVFVISPKGRIFTLPRGSTPVDFAYAVHTDVGHRCVGCRINSDHRPLNTELQSGDQVEIITSAYPSPNPAWLSYVRTGRARARIRHFLKNKQQDEAVSLGERLLNLALRPHGFTVDKIAPAAWDRFLRDRGVASIRDIYADIGLGNRMPVAVARRLLLAQERVGGAAKGESVAMPRLRIHGGEGGVMHLAKCCQPIPGDNVIGVIRRGHGLEIHLQDCPVAIRMRANLGRWVDADWEPDETRLFDVTIRILCRPGHGMLVRIANAIAADDCNIQSAVMDQGEAPHVVLHMTLQVRDRLHLAKVMRRVRQVPEVARIAREKPGN
ncbi:MAG: bifunctional (p)ppGpp synthetase/guanosine-3',5'-bis(diphosphate) 3'-pyrophosphohydrolase [Azoarcus sp.]|jgi:guanosine-3',5'-bis(diphosphate) 3'-pyrophosphohydrolase|nr:bifunctional (p)ppGpp synthetase/guanosine-3',5'-bis(diphosphate) 3'-pyrophosphohydrolase [Azoarcus sp.]